MRRAVKASLNFVWSTLALVGVLLFFKGWPATPATVVAAVMVGYWMNELNNAVLALVEEPLREKPNEGPDVVFTARHFPDEETALLPAELHILGEDADGNVIVTVTRNNGEVVQVTMPAGFEIGELGLSEVMKITNPDFIQWTGEEEV